MDYLLIYLITINALGFTLMLADKHKAQKNKWRIPEFVLLCVAYFGGGIGSLLAMHLVRHKTKKEAFYVGIPLALLAEIITFAIWMLKNDTFF